MKIAQAVLFLVMILVASSCNAEITGTVVDAETGEPIEGAVVLVEWIITKGLPGMSYGETYEVKEALTNKEGKVNISDVLSPFVRSPRVTIYKKGYVAWNSEFIFPDYRKRTDFKRQSGYLFRLEKFKSEYTYVAHTGFIDGAIGTGAIEKKSQMMNVVEWENKQAGEERRRKLP